MAEPLLVLERPIGEPADESLLAAVQALLDDDHDVPAFESLGASVLRYPLSFYADVDLIEVTAEKGRPRNARLCFLQHDGKFYRLNGTSPPIHEVNAMADIRITAETALEYLAFFCFFVRGAEGPFLIADRPANPYLPAAVEVQERHAVFRETALWGQNENGDWNVSSLVYYADAMFYADFVIELGGMVTMLEDTPVLREDDARVDAPLAFDGLLH